MTARRRTAWAAPAWAGEQRLPDVGTKAVLLTLANYADEDFSCFPGQERLAFETCQSVRSVRRQLDRLEALGLIVRERRSTREGYRTSDRYWLQLDASVEDMAPPVGPQPATDGSYPQPNDLPANLAAGQPPTGQMEQHLPATAGRYIGSPRGEAPELVVGVRTEAEEGTTELVENPPQIADPACCSLHPRGTAAPCAGCRSARLTWDQQAAYARRDAWRARADAARQQRAREASQAVRVEDLRPGTKARLAAARAALAERTHQVKQQRPRVTGPPPPSPQELAEAQTAYAGAVAEARAQASQEGAEEAAVPAAASP